MLINKVSNIGICLVSPDYLLFPQLRKRGVILVKAVLDSRAVTEMESELQKDLLDTAGSDQGLEPDIFWYRFVAQEIQ